MSNARGFTIVEVLVALLMLAVGLLSTLSTLASVARTFADAHSAVVTTANAAELLEQLRGGGCATSPGSATEGTMVYIWSVDQIDPELRRVTVIVGSGRLRARADTFSAVIPC